MAPLSAPLELHRTLPALVLGPSATHMQGFCVGWDKYHTGTAPWSEPERGFWVLGGY